MATPNEWVDALSGEYAGWAREPTWPKDAWEDLIGTLTLRCSLSADGGVHAELTSIDLGPWEGDLRADGRHLSLSNDTGATIKLSIESSTLTGGPQVELRGSLCSSSGKVALIVSLRSRSAAKPRG